MRVLLAKMILQNPDLLLLDEPTNHLDLPSISWLEGFLQSYPGTVIIVSHDRYFLDRMVTKIVEVAQQRINIYGGNYSFYETEKATRIEFMQREYENQKEFIRQQERFIERFKAKASKASAAQSLVKKLDKLEIIEEPIQKKAQIKVNFEIAQQPGKVIIDLKNVSKSYGPIHLLKETSREIYRGDKIALIGANGKGKSTLLRIIANRENILGEVTIGHNVQTSFYAQHQIESLDIQNDILTELRDNTKGYTEAELRSLLGCFLFQGDDVFKKITILSGGERARVALAKVITYQSNFLMLDEPTNHLDITSVEMLAQALNNYEGTYVIVSHDRFFIEATANKIWEIEDGKIVEFEGKYSEWLEWKEKKAKNALPPTQVEIKTPEPKKENPVNKEQSKKIKAAQNKFKKVEETLALLNDKKIQLEQDLSNPQLFADKNKFLSTEQEYQSINNQINQTQKEYEELFEELLLLDN
jgi:ATP-binding cassette subfamily F protein 3